MNVVELSYKFAQLTTELQLLNQQDLTLLKNHTIKVNEQSQKLLKAVEDAVNAQLMRPEIRDYVQTLKNLAVRLTGIITKEQFNPIQPVRDLYNQIAGQYDTIQNNYISVEEPEMKSIRDSLVFVDRLLKKIETVI